MKKLIVIGSVAVAAAAFVVWSVESYERAHEGGPCCNEHWST